MRLASLYLVLGACGAASATVPDAGPDALAPDAAGTADAGTFASPGDLVLDPTVLHEVKITVAAADLADLDNDQTMRVPCTLVFDGERLTNVGIRKKGQTSARPLSGKPGFSIKLNEFVPGQRLDRLKKILLDNAIQDPSFLTGHIGYELYRRAGIPAPRTAHAVVTFNGEVKGIYVVEEAINEQFLDAHFGDGSGNLYEGPWDFPKGAAAMELKDEVEEMRSRADLVALTQAVNDSSDAALPAALAPLLDVDQFLLNYAVEVVGAHWDSYAYAAWNFYLYHLPSSGKFIILPHGLNWPYWHADLDPFDLYVYPWGMSTPPGFLCERLRKLAASDARFHALVRTVAADGWDVPALEARVAQVQQTLHSRQVAGARFAEDLAMFDASVDGAYAFIRERKAYLTTLLGL